MRLLSVEVENYRGYEHQVLDLRDVPSAVVWGSTGAGKSSIVSLAPQWCIWGYDDSPQGRAGSFVKLGTDFCKVIVDFEHCGEIYRIARSYSKKKDKPEQALDFWRKTTGKWEPLSDGKRKTQAIIIKELGMDLSLAQATIFSVQGKSDSFTSSKPAGRWLVFRSLMRLERYQRLRKSANDLRKAAKEKVANLEGILEGLHVLAFRSSNDAAKVGEVEAALAEALKNLGNAKSRREEAATLVRKMDKEYEDWNVHCIKVAAAKATEDSACDAADQASKLVEEAYQNIPEESDTTEADLAAELDRLETAVENLESSLEQTRLDEDAAREQLAEVGRLKMAALLAYRDERSARYRAADYRRKEAADDVMDSRRCVLGIETEIASSEKRFQVDLEAAEELLRCVSRELELSGKALAVAGKSASQLKALPFGDKCAEVCPLVSAAVEARDSLDSLGKSTAEIQLNHDDASAALDSLKADQERGRPASIVDRLATAIREQGEFQISYDNLAEEATSLDESDPGAEKEATAEVQRRLVKAEKDSDDARTKLEKLNAATEIARSGLSLAEKKFERVRSRDKLVTIWQSLNDSKIMSNASLGEARTALLALEESGPIDPGGARSEAVLAEGAYIRELESASSTKAATEAQLVAVQERLKESEEATEKSEGVSAEVLSVQARADDLKTLAGAYDDVPRIMVENIIPDIESVANDLLAEISNTGMVVSLQTQRESSKGDKIETLDILVSDTQGERPYEMYSGGEKFMIDWAFRVAIAYVLSTRASVPLDMIVIDEGFGALSSDLVDSAARALATTSDKFSLTLAITHVADLAEAFPTRVLVKSENGSSHLSVER